MFKVVFILFYMPEDLTVLSLWSIQCLVVSRFSCVLDCVKSLNVDKFYKSDRGGLCLMAFVFLMTFHASIKFKGIGIAVQE